jgi:signal transduction histidine kinase
MPERASVMGGRLTVWSEPNIGTEVELRVPAGAAYARTSLAPPVAPNVGRDAWT